MSAVLFLLGALCVGVWLYLLLFNGAFWMATQRDDRGQPPPPEVWPSVVAVVPARDEADVIAQSIGSLIGQDYPGTFHVVLVDDGSSDGTAGAAKAEAGRMGREDRLTVLTGAPLPAGWTGKLWAMSQGAVHAAQAFASELILFTDADIGHDPDNLRGLVARAQAKGLVLTSQMVRLHCKTWPEKLLIPAFVFFFQMLYPFERVNNPKSPTAGAAGGCMLIRREALERAGGVAAIRTALIDDCTLGALMKKQGPIWLGLTDRARSLRPYTTFAQAGRMISRSAYAQLRYSPLVLAGTLLGLFITYIAPPLLALFATGQTQVLGMTAWVLMALGFQPMLRFYKVSPLWGVALPGIGAVYGWLTFQSALDTWRGKGGLWKGRVQAQAGKDLAGQRGGGMSALQASDLASGKDHTKENFPVASFILKPEHRAPVMAFYRFARTADDVSDDEATSPAQKLILLEEMRTTLTGESHDDEPSWALRQMQIDKRINPQHALDLLEAFRRDCIKLRYADWAELMDYCRYSAAPVGRFVLEVHGEGRDTWRANDALCSALQIINHLQDCGKDKRSLDRVYIPQDALAAADLTTDALLEPAATPALRQVIADLAKRTRDELLSVSRPFASKIRDGRLAYEVAFIQRLAEDLCERLIAKDPLSERVHHTKAEMGALALRAGLDRFTGRR